MPVCTKCLLEGIIQGSAIIGETQYALNLTVFADVGDEDLPVERSVTFEGEIQSDRGSEDGFTAIGVLTGQFGVTGEDRLEAEAVANVFNRDGEFAFTHVVVRGGSGRATFVADLYPQVDTAPAAGQVEGVAFMAWPEKAAT